MKTGPIAWCSTSGGSRFPRSSSIGSASTLPRASLWWACVRPEFDPEVLGGNYHGHGPNPAGTDVAIVSDQAGHPILAGVEPAKWHSTGSLYFTAPVAENATVLMTGALEDRVEPLTWVRDYQGSRVVYTGLGHPDDFQDPQGRRLLVNTIFWAMDRPVPEAAKPTE